MTDSEKRVVLKDEEDRPETAPLASGRSFYVAIAALALGIVIGFAAFGGGSTSENSQNVEATSPPTPGATGRPITGTPTSPPTSAPTSAPTSNVAFDRVNELALAFQSSSCQIGSSERGQQRKAVVNQHDDFSSEFRPLPIREGYVEPAGNLRASQSEELFCQDILDELADINTQGWTTDQKVLKTFLEDTVSYDVLDAQYPYWLNIPSHSMRGPVYSIGSRVNPTLLEADDFLSHAGAIRSLARFADDSVDGMKIGLERGYRAHSQTVEQLPKAIDEILDVNDLRDLNVLQKAFDLIDAVPNARDYEEDLLEAGQILNVSLRAYADYLTNDYIPELQSKNESFSIKDRVPEDQYGVYDNYLVPYYTSSSETADQIHQRGLDEVERIKGKMLEIANRNNFGTIEEYRDSLDNLESNKYEEKYHMIAEHMMHGLKLYPKLDALFENLPTEGFTVEAVAAATEDSGASYTYSARRVNVNANFYQNFRKHVSASLMAHEGVPGHHLQRLWHYRIENLHPLRRSRLFTSYTEGYALYTETLIEEDTDFYQEDKYLFGRLQQEQMRAARLTVDTGLHHLGWSYEDCVEYMFSNFATNRKKAEGQCLRYISLPGQALAYKMGEQIILELRRDAEQALGDKFDIKKFHTVLLNAGTPQASILEVIINDWVQEQLNE